MAKLDAAAVSKLLRELAQRLELAGGNPYRARAYSRAAENLLLSPLPLAQLIAEDRLTEIPGIGDALAAVITQLHETGEHPRLEAMREEVPAGVLDMLRVPGLRRERVHKLYKELGIASVADLEDAARSGRLAGDEGLRRGVPGQGPARPRNPERAAGSPSPSGGCRPALRRRCDRPRASRVGRRHAGG